jgi:hypothetical protein
MIVWSKGLGKKSLPMDLAVARLSVGDDHLLMDGSIDEVCWEYTMKLYPEDLGDFMRLLAHPKTARFMAKKGGLLVPFVVRLVMFAPMLVLALFKARVLRSATAKVSP